MPNDNLKANPDITVTLELDAADAAVISDGLRANHFEPDRIHGSCLLALFVRDSQTGKVFGGPTGSLNSGSSMSLGSFCARIGAAQGLNHPIAG
jgi:hypothetical protein